MDSKRYYVNVDGKKVLLSLNIDPVPTVQQPPNFTEGSQTEPKTIKLEPPGEPHRYAEVVDDILSAQQCDELIAFSEQFQWGLFGRSGRKNLCPGRKVWRILVDCPELAESLFEVIKPHLPKKMGGCDLVGFNCRFRFLKYSEPNMHHNEHRDSYYEDPETKNRTQVTVFLYLSEDCEGGETLILHPDKSKSIGVRPKMGRALIFEHRVFHSGNPLISGEKRCLRMDVYYSPVSTQSKKQTQKRTKYNGSEWKRKQKGKKNRMKKDKSDFARFG